MHVLEQEQWLPLSRSEAWAFFSRPRNLEAITPPEMGMRIEDLRDEAMRAGQIIAYRVRVAPGVWLRWVTEIKQVEEGVGFIDEQRIGPYRFWHHEHRFEERDGGVLVKDRIYYRLPLGPVGELAHALWVGRQLRGIFEHRRRVLEERFGGGR